MGKKQYIIKFAGLPVGTHEFEFEIDGKFFEQFADSEIQKANLQVKLTLLKQNHLMQLQFDISGTVNLSCDRCLIDYDFPIETKDQLVLKFGNPDESNDQILVINEGDAQADVSHYLFEYIILALPSRRVPCEIDDEVDCDEETRQKLEESSVQQSEPNPVWEKLSKIKFNKN